MEATVEAARAFAIGHHKGQTDKLGYPYSAHLEDVAQRVSDQCVEVICIAWLHDCVEDTAATLEDIETQFGKVVRDGVDAMTKRNDEDYFADYLERVKRNPHAAAVKAADSSHNLAKAHLLANFEPEKARNLEMKYKRVLSELGLPTAGSERLEFREGSWRVS